MNKFVIKRDTQGKFYWILYASNGQPIARSNSSYASIAACYNGIDSVRRHCDSKIVEEIYNADQT